MLSKAAAVLALAVAASAQARPSAAHVARECPGAARKSLVESYPRLTDADRTALARDMCTCMVEGARVGENENATLRRCGGWIEKRAQALVAAMAPRLEPERTYCATGGTYRAWKRDGFGNVVTSGPPDRQVDGVKLCWSLSDDSGRRVLRFEWTVPGRLWSNSKRGRAEPAADAPFLYLSAEGDQFEFARNGSGWTVQAWLGDKYDEQMEQVEVSWWG